jgi:tripartite ATP-independent transporter DctM subunit
MGPPGEKSGWKQRFVSLKAGGPVALLFVLVIGGIYTGMFTPTEGGAIGVVGALIIGIILRRFTVKSFLQALIESGKTVSMVFIILIGAVIFSRFIAWCNLSKVITDVITGLNLSPGGFMALILFFFFFLGFFIGALPLILVGVPIMYPVALSMGINPLWFAVLMVINICTGASTPPVGVNLFTLKGVAPQIPMGTIYKGVLPFLLAIVVSLIIVFLFPSTVTWLPSLMK